MNGICIPVPFSASLKQREKAPMRKKLRETLPHGGFADVSPGRRRTMKAIRGSGNRSTETCLRMGLVRAGISGWVVTPKSLFGRPDFYFESARVAVFVDGCFWHGCPQCFRLPRTRTEYWRQKIAGNRTRDQQVASKLESSGVTVARYWEHEIRDCLEACVRHVVAMLESRNLNA